MLASSMVCCLCAASGENFLKETKDCFNARAGNLLNREIAISRFLSPQVSFLFSDRGTPDGYRHMNGYGSHTFKMVNGDDKAVYCKFHLKVR